ncbi:MAG: GspH/FimT family protein [Gammaproteobacteria bacterium]|nr:GspH/FimT family protein [Gammaproteobacteria bacterium]
MRVHLQGFSLIELLVVVVIIVIFLAMSIPSEKIFVDKSQQEVMSQQFLRAIYLARSESITLNENVTLCKSNDLKNCVGDWLQGYIIKTNDRLLMHYQNVTSQGIIHWRSFPNGKDSLTFFPSGMTDIQNGTFWYCRSSLTKASWAIVISQSGRARLELPDASGVIVDSSGAELSCA